MIAESDLKDYGVHTEILAESFLPYEAGRITELKTSTATRWSILLPWVPLACMNLQQFVMHLPVNYPTTQIICRNDKVMAINSALK